MIRGVPEGAVVGVGAEAAADGEAVPDDPRKVIHVDMDSFYAAVEQRDRPELRGRPVAVGSPRERGVVTTCSYEARAFGVRSAMPSVVARRLCPDLVFVEPRFDAYKAVSAEIRQVFLGHAPLVEPLSLDEAYLDVTENLKGLPTATAVAKEIRAEIRRRTGLTASAGVSYNKFVAKLASDVRKPDGLFVVTPGMGPAFVAPLPVGRFHGVGPVTAARMNALGIETGLNLRQRPKAFLQEHFGKAGEHYFWISRAVDRRPVVPDRPRKSIGVETTFARDLTAWGELADALAPISGEVWEHCARTGARGRTVTLKAKYSDFRQVTRSRTLAAPVGDAAALRGVGTELAESLMPLRLGVRLLGLALSGLDGGEQDAGAQQLTLTL